MKNENKKGKSVTNILKRSTGVIIIGVFMITLIGTAAWRTYQSEVKEASRIELQIEQREELKNKYEYIYKEIGNDCLENPYDQNVLKITYTLEEIGKLIDEDADKDIILNKCDELLYYMENSMINIGTGYDLKQLIIEEY